MVGDNKKLSWAVSQGWHRNLLQAKLTRSSSQSELHFGAYGGLLSQEPLTLGLRVATLLKLCMAPFESDWKMDPSRLQSLNDSSAKWDSVIQFA